MSRKRRTHRTPEQKASLLREHHLEKKPVSDVCEAADVQPSLFYYWQRQLFENAPSVFEGDKRQTSREKTLEAENALLKAKLADREATITRKDGVIAEISGESVALKKARGEP